MHFFPPPIVKGRQTSSDQESKLHSGYAIKRKKSCVPHKEQKQFCISVKSSARIKLVHQGN